MVVESQDQNYIVAQDRYPEIYEIDLSKTIDNLTRLIDPNETRPTSLVLPPALTPQTLRRHDAQKHHESAFHQQHLRRPIIQKKINNKRQTYKFLQLHPFPRQLINQRQTEIPQNVNARYNQSNIA